MGSKSAERIATQELAARAHLFALGLRWRSPPPTPSPNRRCPPQRDAGKIAPNWWTSSDVSDSKIR